MGTDLSKNFCDKIIESFGIDSKLDVRACSPLTLAYIGDAVFEIIIRTELVLREDRTVQKFHKKCSSMVNAVAQKELVLRIENLLTEEEHSVFKRGRNAKSYTIPKNASPGDYRMATGFEALCGYLYLTDRMERLLFLVSEGLKNEEQNSEVL